MAPPTLTDNFSSLPEHIKYWTTRYEKQSTGWLINNVHPFLIAKVDDWNKSNSEIKKIFVPLCGTTFDLSFLLSQGFQVFGVEGVKSCFDTLNGRDGLGLEHNEKDSTYETSDGQLKIYHGDLYSCPIEKWGPFDYVWDRASFIAIETKFREDYASLMKRALGVNGKDFEYIIEVVEYDKTKFSGPPRAVTLNDLSQLYPEYNIELIQRTQIQESSGLFKMVPVGVEADEVIYKFTSK